MCIESCLSLGWSSQVFVIITALHSRWGMSHERACIQNRPWKAVGSGGYVFLPFKKCVSWAYFSHFLFPKSRGFYYVAEYLQFLQDVASWFVREGIPVSIVEPYLKDNLEFLKYAKTQTLTYCR